MLYRTVYPRDLFAEFDRLARDMQQALDLTPAIRGRGPGAFPALNVGTTPRSVAASLASSMNLARAINDRLGYKSLRDDDLLQAALTQARKEMRARWKQ